MKKILLFFLMYLLMAVDLHAAKGDTFTYTYNGSTLKYYVDNEDNKTVEVYGLYNKKIEEHQPGLTCYVPETVYNEEGEAYTVHGIMGRAFANQTEMETVILPPTRINITSNAFIGCTSLTTVVFRGAPGSVDTGVSSHIFYNLSNLKKVAYPDTYTPPTYLFQMNVVHPSKYAFNPEICEITENGEIFSDDRKTLHFVPVGQAQGYKIPSTVKKLESTFSSTPITEMEIPDNVEEIGDDAFFSCYKLAKLPMGRNVKVLGKSAFRGAPIEGDIILPEGMEKIDRYALEDTKISSLTLPNSIKELESECFARCEQLTSVTLPETLSSIPSYAFNGCSKLESITIPNSVQTIGDGAFQNCTELKNVTLSNATSTLSSYLFKGCSSLASIEIPEGVNSLGREVFMNCTALEEIVLPEELTYISYSTFEGCTALKSVAISEKATTISTSAFKNCSSLSSINFPKTLRTIGENAFQGCEGLTEVVLYPGLQTLGTDAFGGCTGIVKAVYPDNLENQFGDATAIAYPAESLITEEGIIYNPNDGVLYYAPSYIQGEVLIPRGVTKIGPAAFKGCSLLTEIVIPSEVTEIGEEAFADSGIKRLIIGYGMKKIGDRAFAGDKITYFYITALTPPELGEDVFDSMTAKVNVVYSNDYTADPVWSQFNIISYYSNHELASDSKNCFLTPGESKQLSVRFVYPSNADLKYIYWKSSDPEVADVDRNGVVTMNPSAPAGQTCTITAYTLFEKSGIWNFRINEHDMAGVDMFRYGEGLNQSSLFTVKDNNGDGTEWFFGYPPAMFYLTGLEGTTYDDSMITKESFRLQKGKGYKLLVKAASTISQPYMVHETILEVSKYREGDSDNPEILLSEIPGYGERSYPREFPEFVSYFNVEEDGDYYFQFRGYGGVGGLWVWSMVLSEFDTDYYPGPVEGLRAYLETETPLTATVEFTLPSKSIYGAELTEDGISKVEIYRENELVATLTDNLIPGEKIKWIDTAPVEGINKYSVTVHNLNLVSEKSEVSSLISPMTPTVVTDLSVKKIAGGKNRISWTAPVKSVEGLDIDPTVVRYVVKRKVTGQEPETLTTLDAVTEYEDPFNPEEITKVVYTVEAMIKERISAAASTEELVLSLYHLPYTESFSTAASNGKLPEDWPQVRFDGYKGNPGYWSKRSYFSSGTESCYPYDLDGGFLRFGQPYSTPGTWTVLYSPEISVKEEEAVALEFFFFHSSEYPESDDRVEISVLKNREAPVKLEDYTIHRYAEESGWKRYQIYMQDLENVETLQFEFKGILEGDSKYFGIDALKVFSQVSHDLELSMFEVDTEVASGEEATGRLKVSNIGGEDVAASDFEVKVYVDDEEFESFPGATLTYGEEAEYTFSVPTHPGHNADGRNVWAEIIYAADQKIDNNKSAEINIAVTLYDPKIKVNEVNGRVIGNSLHLSWNHIDAKEYEPMESEITLDRPEDEISWAAYQEDPSILSPEYYVASDGSKWRNIDFDKAEMTNGFGKMAQLGFAFYYDRMSGLGLSADMNEYHGFFYCKHAQGVPASDYLVSPLLPGVGHHKLEFLAKEFSSRNVAQFRIEYTTEEDFSEDEVEDIFMPIDKNNPEPTLVTNSNYELYSFDIPADAKYVAIHYTTAYGHETDKFNQEHLHIDNVKLTSEPMSQPTYNVYYRENELSSLPYNMPSRAKTTKASGNPLIKHNDEPVLTGEYVVDVPSVSTDFHVSAVFPEGETELPAPYSFDLQTGLSSVSADSQVRIRVEGRRISAVRNGENVKFTIYTLDGAVVAKDVDSFVAAVSGAYIVKTETTSATVMVK